MQKINLEQSIENYQIKDLNELVRDFYVKHLHDAQRKFTILLDSTSCMCLFDEQSFERVLENLFYNALRFTKENDRISITLKKDSTRAILIFADSGKGMDAETAAHIFESNYTTQEKEEHEGIGLAFVKRVVEQHHGTIQILEKHARGTCFEIRLPLQ